MVTDLRSRKKDRTREALQEAALRLFSETGYRETSVDDIARAADVSRSTFFRYFGSKKAIFFDQIERAIADFLDLIDARPSGETPLRAFEEALVILAESQPQTEETFTRERRRRALLSSEVPLQAQLQDLQKFSEDKVAERLARRDGLTSPGAEHRMAASIGMAVTRAMEAPWEETEGKADPAEFVHHHFAMMRRLAAD